MNRGWIGVDLDGTLAHYSLGDCGAQKIGDPIPIMMKRVLNWIKEGYEVRIFTARAEDPYQTECIKAWLEKHGLGNLKVTNKKDYGMVQLWDDRAIQVIHNTGERADGQI